jgi:hypothetical protein
VDGGHLPHGVAGGAVKKVRTVFSARPENTIRAYALLETVVDVAKKQSCNINLLVDQCGLYVYSRGMFCVPVILCCCCL